MPGANLDVVDELIAPHFSRSESEVRRRARNYLRGLLILIYDVVYGWEKKRRMKRILFVEDHTTFRQALANIIGRESDLCEVPQAGTLAEGRELGLLGEVDLAIVDLALPDGDGLGLIGELRAINSGVSVFAISSTVEMTHPTDAIETGADGIIDKMDTPEAMFAAIRGAELCQASSRSQT